MSDLQNPAMVEAVRSGIALLNQARPGWQQRVDWDHLNMASPFNSILGQLFGTDDTGYYALEQHLADELDVPMEAVEIKPNQLGFSLSGPYTPNYHALTDLWKQLGLSEGTSPCLSNSNAAASTPA
jgi:hypothetical protein